MKLLIEKNILNCVVCGMLMLGFIGCRSTDEQLIGYDDDNIDNIDNIGNIGISDGDYELSDRGDGDFGEPIIDVSFENVAFPYDSFQIADSERGKIEQVADYVNSHQGITVVIDGHCDERGSREYNLSLGEHRALAIRAYLISLGVPGDAVQTRSFGEEQPVDPGHDATAWSNNRRGEFSLYR